MRAAAEEMILRGADIETEAEPENAILFKRMVRRDLHGPDLSLTWSVSRAAIAGWSAMRASGSITSSRAAPPSFWERANPSRPLPGMWS